MRALSRLPSFIVATALVAACNAILGNESAVFDPAAAADAANDGVVGPDGSTSDAAGDAAANDADTSTPCVDTTSDPKHCGTCGHDCLGGACVKGRCQVHAVVTEPGRITALAVDSTHVYWSNSNTGDVKRVPLGGGAEQTIFDAPNGTDLGDALVRLGTDIYFAVNAANGAVYRCPATGCAGGIGGPDVIFAPIGQVRHLAVAPTGRVTFAENIAAGRVINCIPPCGFGTNIVSPSEGFPRFVAVADSETYWTTLLPIQGNVRARVGASPDTILAGQPARELALVPDAIVLADLGAGPSIMQRDGGAFRKLGSDNNGMNNDHVAVDGALVYFNDTVNGRILKCPLNGCDGGAEEVAIAQASPYAIAIDKAAIYWTNLGAGTSNVMRLAK